MTPAQRQTNRRNAGKESPTVHPELGPNGVQFKLKAGAPVEGSVAYGAERFSHSVSEAASDNGVNTGDRNLAIALRGLDIYNETKL